MTQNELTKALRADGPTAKWMHVRVAGWALVNWPNQQSTSATTRRHARPTYARVDVVKSAERLSGRIRSAISSGGASPTVDQHGSDEARPANEEWRSSRSLWWTSRGRPYSNFGRTDQTYDGNECLLLKDTDGVLSGIVLINAAQNKLYKLWCESLLIDWTHHSNNLGFHLGGYMQRALFINYGE
ncbi:hypothetical protein JG688_00008464 [Phytophthora aleatoria]|uniref:Uncharacterized protein n=1 Tax=Phytophthora aleatoria TaxID=2496075 RepID=A0A8J5II08_9STRA|nr:hypothetical protein JG688_00008464 [Phytophthora aleatoria]